MKTKVENNDLKILNSLGFKEGDINLLRSISSQISTFERKSFDRLNKSKTFSLDNIKKIENEIIRNIFLKLSKDIPRYSSRIKTRFFIRKIVNDGFKFNIKFFQKSSHFNSQTGKEKVKYLTKRDADSHIRSIEKKDPDSNLNSYTCLYCGQIHIGNL